MSKSLSPAPNSVLVRGSKRPATFSSHERGIAHLFLLVVVILVAISAVGYLAYKNGQLKLTSSQKQVSPTLTTSMDEAADWKTYVGKYLSFKYPPHWSIETKRYKCNYLEEVIIRGTTDIYEFKVEVVGLNYVTEASFPPQNWSETSVNLASRKGARYEFINEVGRLFITIALIDDNNVNYVITLNIVDAENAKPLINKVLSTFILKDKEVYEEDKELILIDNWIEENNLNSVGDLKSTLYGSGPLFNELTGERICRYEYIIKKRPDKPWG